MGLGLLGRGVGDAEYLASVGAELTITDLKTKEQLADSLERLSFFKNITYVLGEHRLEDFQSCDMVLKAAGVPFDSLYIAEAKKNGIPVYMSGALFAKLSGVPVIAVTGSRGKSTTTQLIYHTLSRGTEGGTVHLGGNVRGVSNLQLLKNVEDGDVAVMELDSWQLQGFGELEMSPHIAIFTSFLPDHMDYYFRKSEQNTEVSSSIFERGTEASEAYYRASERSGQASLDTSEGATIASSAYREAMERYFDDKAFIFANQEPGDTFITTPAVFAHVEAYAKRKGCTLVQDVVLTDASDVPVDWNIQIPGEHNLANIALAMEALRATTLPEDLIREGVESFTALPGRLEFLGEVKGVKIYNDNNATSPIATLAGLKAVAEEKNVLLIMGGSDKKLDMDPLLSELPKYAKEIILLPGTGTDTIKESLSSAVVAGSMKDAVHAAFSMAESGDVILLSPAFASFGLFKNEYDRNDQFVALIKEKIK